MEQPPIDWTDATPPQAGDTLGGAGEPTAGPQSNGPSSRWRSPLAMAGGIVAAAGLTAGLAFGGSAMFAGADTTSTTTPAGQSSGNRQEAMKSRISEALQGLVDKGTITADQRSAVVDALASANLGGGGGRFRGAMREGIQAAAKAIGISADDLRTQVRSGKSIADVAKAKNVSVDKVIDAIVAAEKQFIADHPNGPGSKLTDAEIKERVTTFVNRAGGEGLGRRGDRRGGNHN